MLIEMKVKFLTFDPSSNGFVVLLTDLENKHALPIWIGPFEANAIALKLKKAPSHRPLSHDLIRNFIDVLDCKISHVVVSDLKENTYYGLIYIKSTPGPAMPSPSLWVRRHQFLSRRMFSIEQKTSCSTKRAGIPLIV
jgi:bifunctional DNase/RNase